MKPSAPMKSIIRTILLSAIGTVVVLFAFMQIRSDVKDRQIRELRAMTERMEAMLAQKEAMLERLARDRRVAHIDVLSQEVDPDTGTIITTTVMFIEVDDRGRELARRTMTIPGGVLFVDCWTVKFHNEDVAIGHPLRGRTLILLRRLYSDQLAPRDGLTLDTPGAIPAGYAGSEAAVFEQQIWAQFWHIATDPQLARELGVRIAQGEVVYKPVRAGEAFVLAVDAAGGMNLVPLARDERRASQPG